MAHTLTEMEGEVHYDTLTHTKEGRSAARFTDSLNGRKRCSTEHRLTERERGAARNTDSLKGREVQRGTQAH